jgi:hypothetical protein
MDGSAGNRSVIALLCGVEAFIQGDMMDDVCSYRLSVMFMHLRFFDCRPDNPGNRRPVNVFLK